MPDVSPGCILDPIEIWALLLSMETNETAPVPRSPLGSLSCLISSLPTVEMQSQKAKQKHTHTKRPDCSSGWPKREPGGAGYVSLAAGLSVSPMTYLAVCFFGMSASILSSWLSTSVITLMLGNSRKQTPLWSLASQVARWGYSTPGMPGWAHPRLWQSCCQKEAEITAGFLASSPTEQNVKAGAGF